MRNEPSSASEDRRQCLVVRGARWDQGWQGGDVRDFSAIRPPGPEDEPVSQDAATQRQRSGQQDIGERHLDTGHGTGIDVQTLKGVIHDEAAFARWAGESADPLLAVIGPLLRGDLDAAQTALDQISSNADPKVQFRLRALGADILRDRGLFAEAAGSYVQLLAEFAGTSREGVLRQHLGKVYFVAGDYVAARDCFAEALRLRRSQGADAELIESSMMALERADEEVIGKGDQGQGHLPGS